VRNKSLFFGIIGTVTVAVSAVNVKSLQTNLSLTYIDDDYTIQSLANIPKKQDLLGTYTVKDDKHVKLILNDNGTYYLAINVCNDYLTLSGSYELRDSKLILKNTNELYDDLIGNEELSFTIKDDKSIISDESLICTVQETLFEK
jgi:hypothetical protein